MALAPDAPQTEPLQSPASWAHHVHMRLHDRLSALGILVSAPTLSSADVHLSRRLLKDANALVLLLAECVTGVAKPTRREVARLLKQMRHAMNDARDLDVIAETLAPWLTGLPKTQQTALTRALAARRARVAPHQDAEAGAPTLVDLYGQITSIIASWDVQAQAPEAVARAARRAYTLLRQRGAYAFETHSDEALHDLRKPLIVHRHQIEALGKAWPKMFDIWADEAQDLRDKLGEHHDLMMVSDFAKAVLGPKATGLVAKIEATQAQLEQDSAPIFARLCAEKPRAFERRLMGYMAHPKKQPHIKPNQVAKVTAKMGPKPSASSQT